MILCFGEISWDRLLLVDNIPSPGNQAFVKKEIALPGGCTLNTAVHLAMMKESVTLGGNNIGRDIYASKIIDQLQGIGINFKAKQIDNFKTPICDVLIDEVSKERSFLLHHDGIQDFHPDMFDGIDLDNIDMAFVDPYLKEASSALLELLQNRCGKIWLQDLTPEDNRVALGDVVQISLDESLCTKQNQVKAIAEKYFRGRCSSVMATVGKQGAFLVRSDGLFIFDKPVGHPEHPRHPEPFEAQDRLREGSPRRRDSSPSAQSDGCSLPESSSHPASSCHPESSRHPEEGSDEGSLVVDTTGCGDAFRAGAMKAWKNNESWESILISGIERGTYQATIFGSNPLTIRI